MAAVDTPESSPVSSSPKEAGKEGVAAGGAAKTSSETYSAKEDPSSPPHSNGNGTDGTSSSEATPTSKTANQQQHDNNNNNNNTTTTTTAAAGLVVASNSEAGASETSSQSGADNKTLYLGNLHPFVTEITLQEVFSGLPGVTEVKVIKDKITGISAGYGFANFRDPVSAQGALDKLGRLSLFGQEVRMNWAFRKPEGGGGNASTGEEEDIPSIHIFVGDLSSDVTDAMLFSAFQHCVGCSDARVMWDHATGRSRGYGFVTFRKNEEGEDAIAKMNGQFVGSRKIRCGWAQHKTDDIGPIDPILLNRADPTNTNIYVGNLPSTLPDAEIRNTFSSFGPLEQMKIYKKGGYGFVRYKNHDDAVAAIVGMNGQSLGGRVLKCSWGRHPAAGGNNSQAGVLLAAAGMSPMGGGPMALGGPHNTHMGGLHPVAAASLAHHHHHHHHPHAAMMSQMSNQGLLAAAAGMGMPMASTGAQNLVQAGMMMGGGGGGGGGGLSGGGGVYHHQQQQQQQSGMGGMGLMGGTNNGGGGGGVNTMGLGGGMNGRGGGDMLQGSSIGMMGGGGGGDGGGGGGQQQMLGGGGGNNNGQLSMGPTGYGASLGSYNNAAAAYNGQMYYQGH